MPVVDHPRTTRFTASSYSPAQLAQTGTARDDIARVWRCKQEILQAAQILVALLLGTKSDERREFYEDHAFNYTRHAYSLQPWAKFRMIWGRWPGKLTTPLTKAGIVAGGRGSGSASRHISPSSFAL
jgi:hypothetical protein